VHQLGLPIKLKLVGSVLDSFDLLKEVYHRYPNSKECLEYIGDIPHEKLSQHYHNADAFVFGSSCENLPIILLEAMNAGLPIASSNYGPMGEVLGSSAVYFNPYKISSIKNAVQFLFENHELRQFMTNHSFNKGKNYTWDTCANKTFKYLIDCANHYHHNIN
jgi:glycosyltransferase involved in cell wall biosynthesis